MLDRFCAADFLSHRSIEAFNWVVNSAKNGCQSSLFRSRAREDYGSKIVVLGGTRREEFTMTLVECFVAYTLLCISAVTALPYSDDGLRNKELAGHRVLAIYGKQEDGRSPHCKVIFEDRTGVYWAGTFGGLKRYDEKSDRWNDEIRVPRNVDFIARTRTASYGLGAVTSETKTHQFLSPLMVRNGET